MRTLLELNDVDPADMTLDELASTWKGETDPESAPHPAPQNEHHADRFRAQGFTQDATGRWRRPFNYSTRGANAGPSPKYRKRAPEVYGGRTLSELCKPTAADRAAWAARPLTITPAPRHTSPQVLHDGRSAKRNPPGYVVGSRYGLSVEDYRARIAKRRAALVAARESLNLYFHPALGIRWAEPVAPIPAPKASYVHGQAPQGVTAAKIPGGSVVVIDVAAVAREAQGDA